MATENLLIKTLGSVELSSGTGIPDHVAPKGSFYIDTNTSNYYTNIDGGNGWKKLVHFDIVEIVKTASETVNVNQSNYTNSFLDLQVTTGQEFVQILNGRIKILSEGEGKWFFSGSIVLNYVNKNCILNVSLIKNTVPDNFAISMLTLTKNNRAGTCFVQGFYDLVQGDEINLGIIANKNTQINISNLKICMWKIGGM